MRFTIMVTGPAYGTQMASSAYQFTQELLASNHEIISVFFYKEGVYNANLLISPASDENDLVRCWYNLYKKYNIALHVCIAAALRRGITNVTKSDFIKHSIINLQDGFLLSSLSVLAEAVLTCDRMVQF